MERWRQHLPWAAAAGALGLFGGLAFAGVPLGSLLVLGLVLTCPLLMAGMHLGSGHGHGIGGDVRGDHAHVGPPSGEIGSRHVGTRNAEGGQS